MALNAAEQTNLVRLVVGMFNAAPGATYLNAIASIYEANGHNLSAVAATLSGTPAFQSIYSNAMTSQQFATAFLTTLGLQSSTLANDWVVAKAEADTPRGQIILEAITILSTTNASEFQAAKAMLANKVEVGLYYSVTKNVAETDLGDLQLVVAGVTADAATVTSTKTAIDNGTLGVDGIQATLTSAQNIVVGNAGNDNVFGLFGGADATYNGGDDINLGAGAFDRLNLTATGVTPSTANTVKNTEFINIEDTVGATFNALLVENAPTITFTNTVSTQPSTVTNAGLASTYGLAGAGNLTVGFVGTGGTADTGKLSLSGTGTSTTLRSALNVAAGDTIEAVSIATAGTNFVTLNAGLNAGTVTVTGNGTNNIAVGTIRTTSTIDASASTGTNTFALGGSLSNGDVVKGGTGADTAIFTAATAIGVVTFSGVETLSGTINADVTLGLGTSTGVKTLNYANTAVGTGSLTVTNATAELATVNITEQAATNANDFNLSYATGQLGSLTVNLGSTASTAAAVTMNDMTFTRVQDFTLNGIGTKALDVADINLSSATKTLTLSTAAGADLAVNGYITLGTGSSNLETITLTAGADSSLSAYGIDASGGSSGAENVAINATVGASGDLGVGYGYAGSFGDINLTVGSGGSGYLGSNYAELGGFGNTNITVASGGSAYVSGYTYSGGFGNVNLTVGSDADGTFRGYASGGDVGDFTVDVGASGSAYITAYGFEDDEAAEGNIGNLNGVLADDAYISAYLEASGSVGNATFTGSDDVTIRINQYGYNGDVGTLSATLSSGAFISAWSSAGSGDIGAATISVGDDSYVRVHREGGASTGAISVTAGQDSTVYAHSYSSGGTAGAITITGGSGGSGGDYASAYASGGSIEAINLAGWLGSYNIDAQGVTQGTVINGGADGGTVYATSGADVINGGAGNDTLYGFDGADVINGLAGADLIFGGNGADLIDGGAGNDTLYGEAGNDTILGGAGTDAIDGGLGNDTINGNAGKDTMTGGGAGQVDTFVFQGSSLVTAAAITSFTTGSTDVITDFVTTEDKLDFTTAGSATNYAESTVNAVNLATLLAQADTALNGTVKYYFGQIGGTTGYLVYSEDGTNALAVVELTGVADMAYTDIV